MGWTIALRATGAQGAWTTLWTGVDGPKRQPAHGPDHRDCPHPRAFAHALHRAKGVTGSPFGFVLGEGLVSQGGQIDLDAPEPYGFGSRDSSIDRLEDSPASPLAFQHAGFRSLPELDEVVAYSNRVVVMRDREMVAELSGADVAPDRIVQAIAATTAVEAAE